MTWGAIKHENVTQFARPVFLDDFEPANAPPAASTLGLFEISFFELITFRVLLSNSICSPSVENYKNLWYFVDVTVIKTFSRASPRSWKMEIFSPPKMAILVFWQENTPHRSQISVGKCVKVGGADGVQVGRGENEFSQSSIIWNMLSWNVAGAGDDDELSWRMLVSRCERASLALSLWTASVKYFN